MYFYCLLSVYSFAVASSPPLLFQLCPYFCMTITLFALYRNKLFYKHWVSFVYNLWKCEYKFKRDILKISHCEECGTFSYKLL